jgi:Tfp pilus assembly protein PilF
MDRADTLKQFLEANPNDSFARYGLAMEHLRQGNTQAALAEFKKLVEMNPDYTAAYQMAAQGLMKAGQSDQARSWLDRGIASAARTGNAHARAEMQGMLDELESS